MNIRRIGYWAATGLAAAAFVAGGAMDVSRSPAVAAIMTHLGYPLYFAAILGAWKILGGLAILAPGVPRLKEWAYAGMFFDLTGAALSHTATGDPAKAVGTPLVLLAVVATSWALRPNGRVMAAVHHTGAGAVPELHTAEGASRL